MVTPEQAWAEALASVIAGRKPAEVALAIDVAEETVRRWLRGDTVPTWKAWRELVCLVSPPLPLSDVEYLLAARDAVASKPGPKGPRLSDEEVARRAVERRNGRAKVRK